MQTLIIEHIDNQQGKAIKALAKTLGVSVKTRVNTKTPNEVTKDAIKEVESGKKSQPFRDIGSLMEALQS